MTNLGRLVGVIAGVLLVIGATVFLFFRLPFASEGVYRVKTAVGLDAATPERHIVPEGFHGWAVVHYRVEGAPPLHEDDGAVIVEYPADGRLETSTPAPGDGSLFPRGYYRRTASGLAPLSRVGDIWGEYSHIVIGDNSGDFVSRSSGFFVGTLAEFRATKWPAEHAVPEKVRD